MSFQLILSRTFKKNANGNFIQDWEDLHVTDIEVLKPFEKTLNCGYVRTEPKPFAEFFCKGDANVLCSVLGELWESKINKTATAQDALVWAKRLDVLDEFLEEKDYFRQIAKLFHLMADRGIGAYLSW